MSFNGRFQIFSCRRFYTPPDFLTIWKLIYIQITLLTPEFHKTLSRGHWRSPVVKNQFDRRVLLVSGGVFFKVINRKWYKISRPLKNKGTQNKSTLLKINISSSTFSFKILTKFLSHFWYFILTSYSNQGISIIFAN